MLPVSFATLPEDLAALRAQELAKIGRASAPRDLAKAHFGLTKLLRKEGGRRAKTAASQWAWDGPHFDTPLARRQLRILSGLFSALCGRDHSAEAWEDDHELRATCTIGETAIQLKFTHVGRHRTEIRAGRQQPARDLPAATPLRIELTYALRASVTTAWQDEPGRPLEQQLAGIAADLIVAGEASFRQSLVEAREHAERMRRWQDEAERKRLEELNRERLTRLESSGALLRQADQLRALVERVVRAVAAGGLELNAGELEAWREWALAKADELDPVLSAQVLGHIRPIS